MTDPHQLSRRNLLQIVGLSTVGVAGVGAAAGCAPAEPSGNTDNNGGAGGGEFHGAWPFKQPPEGNFNAAQIPYTILGDGIYGDLITVPSAYYRWADQTWELFLLEDYALDEESATFTLNLKEGLKWSDGADLTAQDYVSTWYTQAILSSPLWNYISKVEAVDDLTVTATMNQPSTAAERYLLRQKIIPTSQFGDFAERAQKLIDNGKEVADDQGLLDDLNAFSPDEYVASGPYQIDYSTVTNTEITMVKNETGYAADTVKFDKLVIYNGETNEVTPLVQGKNVDYATHGFPVATEEAFSSAGVRILRPPVYSGPALLINYEALPEFEDPKVRQAIAMAVDRGQNGEVALGPSGVAVKYMAGLSDSTCEQWVDSAALGALNTYDYDQDAAKALLEEAGWKQDGGKWKLPNGKSASYQLAFPQTFADWSGSATDLKDQLNGFGFDIQLRGKDDKQAPVDLAKGDFQLAINAWGSSTHTHPYFSYVQDYLTNNYPITRNQGGRGISYDLNPTTEVAGKVDIQKLMTESGSGLDEEAQKEKITQLAQVFNEELPIIPMFERFGNNPALEGDRVQAFPADDDPILQNAPYADNFVILGILLGTMEPAAS